MASIRRNMRFLRRLKPIIGNVELLSTPNCNKTMRLSRCYCTQDAKPSEGPAHEADPFLTFMRSDVQAILTRLTGLDGEKAFEAFRTKTNAKPLFKLLTDEELQEAHDEAMKRAGNRLQMPPFMSERKPRDHLICDDSDIAPAIKTKYVFVDISWKTKRILGHGSRPIVCRYPDGKLKWGDWDQVDRMSQIFDPVEGRMLVMPKMFEPRNLDELLEINQPEYRYILERACVQFEPDSDDYIRVTRRIYEEVAKRRDYDALYSTRFYGPMAFYFCWVKSSAPLMYYLIRKQRMIDAALLVRLCNIVDPEFKLRSSKSAKETVQQYVAYAKDNALKGWMDLVKQMEDMEPKRLEAD